MIFFEKRASPAARPANQMAIDAAQPVGTGDPVPDVADA
jgi:hypothetical protein